MNVYLNEITGMDDALISMYMSKRTWTPEINEQIKSDWHIYNFFGTPLETLNKRIESFCKFAWKHTTMLDFVTISVTVEGMHRAGQDDWDAHACRYNNRIIRSSTRLADFDEDEMSDYYRGKIIPTEMALRILDTEMPDKLVFGKDTYIKTTGGYIREDLKDNRDVKRGLYRLCIPSNFIFKCNMAQWAHVYKMRNEKGTANPEVKELAEKIQDLIEQEMPWFNREFLQKVEI